MKKVLVTGANGQLGTKIQEKINQGACSDKDWEWFFLSHNELDITDSESIHCAIKKYRPDIIVNCAAYTNVSKAETDEGTAFEVNAYGPMKLGAICFEEGIFLIHISTDFVFSGADKPIPVDYKPAPLNAYGRSKNWGEFYIRQSKCKHIIIRTSWLYSDTAEHKNFVKAIADKLLQPDCADVGVVANEVGSPTYAGDLADFILLIIELDYGKNEGTYHYCNHGAISRYDFAKAIQEILSDFELLEGKKNIIPLYGSNSLDKVTRPAYSALNNQKVTQKFDVSIPYWKDSLTTALTNLMRNKGIMQ